MGAAGVQSVLADAVPQPWTVSATLRGFYDDNYTTTTGSGKRDSFGLELSPSLSANVALKQTDLGVRYTYGLLWYQDRQVTHQNPFDQTHQLDFWLDHAFDERWKTTLSDTFAVGQEPQLLNPALGSAFGTSRRTKGDNIGNHFNIKLDTQWTRQFSTEVHYGNDYYNYKQNGGTASSPSLSGLLDRDENNVGIDLQWAFQPTTVGFIGYSADWIAYTGDEPIQTGYTSSDRDLLAHQIYVGLQHQFTASLTGTAKVGASYNDSYNDNTESWSPYANVSLTYTYTSGSYIQAGFTHDVNATDVRAVAGVTGLAGYQESSIGYLSINHSFTENLFASAVGQIQYSDYHSGANTGGSDVTYDLGISLNYKFNQFFAADAGYNFDDVDSTLPGRSYTRNRVHIGVTGTY